MKRRGIKQSTLNFVLGGSSLVLAVILVVLSLQVMSSFEAMRTAEERQSQFKQLGFDLSSASDYLTNEMRAYVQFGDQVHYDNYWQEVKVDTTRDHIIAQLQELGAPQNELDLVMEAKRKSDTLVATEEQAMEAVAANNFEDARRLMFGTQYEQVKISIKQLITTFQDTMNTRTSAELEKAAGEMKQDITLMLVLIAFTALFSISSLLLSHFKIIRPIIAIKNSMMSVAEGKLSQSVKVTIDNSEVGQLALATTTAISSFQNVTKEVSTVLGEMSKGNLTVSIQGEYKGDFAEIKRSLHAIIESFNEVLSEVKAAANQVATASTQLSDSSIGLSQGATEQASTVEQLTASIEQIAGQTTYNAEHATDANNLTAQAKLNAQQGNTQMAEMLKAMEDINDSSTSIHKIIKVIDEIAFQTNILALNAAVEAARAGQHGKGFAVVAEEVRNLAARSAQAAQETTDMIEGSIKKVKSGTSIANETASALHKIVADVERVATLVGEISVASNEQAIGIAQVNQGIMQVSQVVQTNAATSQESAAASEELSSQAALLNERVSRFKLKGAYQRSTYKS